MPKKHDAHIKKVLKKICVGGNFFAQPHMQFGGTQNVPEYALESFALLLSDVQKCLKSKITFLWRKYVVN